MNREQEKWLARANFDELMEFCKSERSDEFFREQDNAKAYFARLHDLVEEACEQHARTMLEWGNIPLEPSEGEQDG